MGHDFLTTVESHYFAISFYLFIFPRVMETVQSLVMMQNALILYGALYPMLILKSNKHLYLHFIGRGQGRATGQRQNQCWSANFPE